jgi:hypothetical protein
MNGNDGIELRIDTIVCDGFDPVDRHAFGRAVERDLARLLRERGVPASLSQDRDIRAIVAPEIDLPDAATPDAMARELARAIYDGLGQ